MERKLIPLENIYLNPENPRHEPKEAEKETIDTLLNNEEVYGLAKNISQKGQLSPMDLLGLVPHAQVEGAYTCIEGNRRVCALKLLTDPDKAPTEHERRRFRKLQSQAGKGIPNEIPSVVFENDEDYNEWIELRHGGAQDGAGLRPWDALQKARHAQSQSGTKNLALELIEYAILKGIIENKQKKGILTTINRMLSTPQVRDSMGITSAKELEIDCDIDEFNTVLKKLFEDAISGHKLVNSRTNKDDRKDYADLLRKEGYSPKSRGGVKYDPKSFSSTEHGSDSSNSDNESDKQTKNKGGGKARHERKHLIPSDIKSIKHDDPVLGRLIKEGHSIDVESYCFSSIYLLRAIIECSVEIFLKANDKSFSNMDKLHSKIGFAREILSSNSNNDSKVLRVLGQMSANNKTHEMTPYTIGGFVHGQLIPTKNEIITKWDNFEPAYLAMGELIKKHGQ